MPKELTHLIISSEALQRVKEKAPETAELLSENIDLFMLGSLICDTAYYHIPIFNKKKSIICISQIIHTDGGDISKDFVVRLAKNRYECKTDQHFAFLCGVLSHHIADRAFHPLVIYLTGNYHDDDPQVRHSAQARHRFLEGLIDLNLTNNSNIPLQSKKDGKLFLSMEKDVLSPLLLSFVYAAMPQLEEERAKEITSILFKVSGFQIGLLNLYGKGYFRRIILAINRLFRFKFSGYAAMLYPERREAMLPLFAKKISYLDPFTGEKKRETLSRIKERAVDDLTNAIIACHAAKADLSKALAPYFRQYSKQVGQPKFMDTTATDEVLNRFLGLKVDL